MLLAEMTRSQNAVFGLSNRACDLALGIDESGLHLAGVPLLTRRRGLYRPRRSHEIKILLSQAYGAEIDADAYTGGLSAVANALNEGAMSRAMIAATFLKLPALDWAGAVRIARADDALKKYNPDEPRDALGRWTTGSDGAESLVQEQDPVRLPDGPRIDELGDFLEWIANAKPEDAADIRSEIKRYYYDVGDFQGGDAMEAALSQALEPGATREDRLSILKEFEPYTRADPALVAAFENTLVSSVLLGIPRGAEEGGEAPTTAQDRSNEPSLVWKLGWGERGIQISRAFGQNLPDNFPVIDRFSNGVATSIKSIDLRAKTYQDPSRLMSRIEKYVVQLEKFNPPEWGKSAPLIGNIIGKELRIVVPRNSVSISQNEVLGTTALRYHNRKIDITINEY